MTNLHSRDGVGDGEHIGEIEASVLAYLQRHPLAADTLRGIVNWWLPLQHLESGSQQVERALSELVNFGVLRRDTLPDGEVLYTLDSRTRSPRQH